MRKRKATYSAHCLLRDVRRQDPAVRQASATLLASVEAHLRVACWQYERVEILGLGYVEARPGKGPGAKPVLQFTPDPKLLADIRAVWGAIE